MDGVFETCHLAGYEKTSLRESQGFKVKDLAKAQQLAEENRNLIIQKWNEHLA
jgi:hypothetical protein